MWLVLCLCSANDQEAIATGGPFGKGRKKGEGEGGGAYDVAGR
jgi:hypothetical protein